MSLLELIIQYYPDARVHIDQIKQHNLIKEENEANLFESAISPTTEDLFKDKKKK